MSEAVQFLPDGTVTTPQGFLAGATYAGMKTYSKDKLDLGLLISTSPCTTVGTFTTNSIQSPSVVLTRSRVTNGKVLGVVANSGIANACIGDQGMLDAEETVELAAQNSGLTKDQLAICSTGIIGVELPMALIRASIPKITLTEEGGLSFAKAILTTDRYPKSLAVELTLDNKSVKIGGCIKGSGMIHPNMATMLAFLTTDAAIEPTYLHSMFQQVVHETFNMATIDGDTSTNDTALLFANGESGNKTLDSKSPESIKFEQALRAICDELTRKLVHDAEGSSKIFSVKVEGARNQEDARVAAKTIASSSLVKSAVHGNDPNWGRVIAAVGRSGAEVQEDRISFYINDVAIMESGKPIAFHKDAVIVLMDNPEISFTVKLNLGDAQATAWGCELTEEYVTFNSAYTT